MRASVASAVLSSALLFTACATPPLRPVDPSQAVANDRSAGTAFANGIRIVVRPAAWRDGDVGEVLTPVEVAIHNGSDRPLQVRPASFALLVPGGFRYEALSPQDVRHVLGPLHGRYGYAVVPWGPPFYPWVGPYGRWWGWGGFGPSPWWGPAIFYGGSGYGRVPSEALTRGTLDPGGNANILLFFPVPADNLNALELEATLADASGQRIADLRVPFVREGHHAEAMALPAAAGPPQAPGPAGAAPAQPGTWQTIPPTRPPATAPPPQQQPPVDAPVGPAVPAPEPPQAPQ